MSWIEDPGVAYFNGLNISELTIDQAWLNVTSLITDTAVWMYELSSDCHKCPYQRIGVINPNGTFKHKFSTKFPMQYRFRSKDNEYPDASTDSFKICDIDHDFGEFGVYNIIIGGSVKSPECKVETALDPVNIYYPLLIAFLFYLILGISIYITTASHNRIKAWFQSSRSTKTSSSTVENGSSPSSIESPVSPSINAPGGSSTTLPNHLTTRRLSSASSNGTLQSSSNPNGNVYGHGHGHHPASVTTSVHNHPNGCDIYAGSCTTEVAISTISSIPTSTAVTTYSNGKTTGSCADIANSCVVESPSAVQSVVGSTLNRMPINASISNGNNANVSNTNQSQASSGTRQPRQRLRSLDTFRGMCIIIMIFVNDGGAHYYFFEHATWDGLYVADLVFPWFLWIMGVCIPVSIKSQVKRGTSKFEILRRVFVRSCKLIGIGLLLGSLWGPVDINTMRIPGVLQRFGVCYFVCSTLVLFCMTVNITKPEANKLRAAMQDIQIIWISWLIVLLFVFVHCMLTFFLPIEGCPTGYLGPGGLHESRAYAGICVGGASGYIDREVFQSRHIYQWPTAKQTYKSEAYDPEGMLGTLTSIFQVWLGVQTGVTMLVYPRASSRLKRWGAWAVVTGALGALLCGCKQTGGWIPLNKNLWSLSFVLVTNCFALTLLSFLYFVIDIKRWWSGSPFFEPGMNSILLYVGHSVANRMLPWHYTYGPMRTHFSRLIESLWGTTLWVLLAVYLYAKKKFWVV